MRRLNVMISSLLVRKFSVFLKLIESWRHNSETLALDVLLKHGDYKMTVKVFPLVVGGASHRVNASNSPYPQTDLREILIYSAGFTEVEMDPAICAYIPSSFEPLN